MDLQSLTFPFFAEALAKTKPDNLTLCQYYLQERNRLLKKWQDGEMAGKKFDAQIASAHLKSIGYSYKKELAGPAAFHSTSEWSENLFSSSSISPENLESDYANNKTLRSIEGVEELRRCLDALVKLQVLIATRKAIPFKTVQDFMSLLDHQSESDRHLMLEDSGNSSSHSILSMGHLGIPNPANLHRIGSCSASFLKAIGEATDVAAQTERCLQPLLDFVQKAIFHNPVKSYNRWKGSILMEICDSLAEWCTYSVCQKTVTGFVDEILVQLWPNKETSEVYILEYQLAILAKLCRQPDLCLSTLNNSVFLICKVIKSACQLQKAPDWQLSVVIFFLDFVDLLFEKCHLQPRPTAQRSDSSETQFVRGFRIPEGFSLWNVASLNSLNDRDRSIMDRLETWRRQFEELACTLARSSDCPTIVYQHLLSKLNSIGRLINEISPPDTLQSQIHESQLHSEDPQCD